METYKITYIGIGGVTMESIIEAESIYDARDVFKRCYWAYHEIIDIEIIPEKEN